MCVNATDTARRRYGWGMQHHRAAYQKSRAGFATPTPPGFFAAEAAGLRWLGAALDGPRVAQVLDVRADHIDLEYIQPVHPVGEAAYEFGQRLANLHNAGAAAWGALPPALWPDVEAPPEGHGYFGPLDSALDMLGGHWLDWASFYAEARLMPIYRQGFERGVFTHTDAVLFDDVRRRLPELAGAALDEAPSRLHGDLWSGNLMWTFNPESHLCEAVLIDPAAHGGHREFDLAMLTLFGAPHLAEIMEGYQSVQALSEGWQGRVRLHQLYPIAAHAVLFGGSYIDQTRAILREYAK